jgi:ubiquitin C-terminal hydrolase
MLGSKHMEMVNYQDKLYWIYRKINKDRIKEGHILDVRDAWHCDTVLKTKNQEEDILLFLVEIPDAIIIDTPPPSPAAIVE